VATLPPAPSPPDLEPYLARFAVAPPDLPIVPEAHADPLLLRDWLAAGPYTLVLSSGFCAMHHHAALLSVLTDAGVSPAAVAGTSAGACVAALHAAGMTPEQMTHLMANPPGVVELARPWREPGGLLSSRRITSALEQIVQKYHLAGTLDTCALPVSVSTYCPAALSTFVLGGSMRLAKAIVASLAVPLLFAPVRLDGVGVCVDGGVGDFPGIAGVSASQRVLYHHASVLPLAVVEVRNRHTCFDSN
jgi:hypothetical protein